MNDNWRHKWAEALRSATELSSNAILLGHCLIFDFRNRRTGQCNPGHDTIAKSRGWSDATVTRAIRDLVKAGWIVKENSTAHNTTANYIFRTPGERVSSEPKAQLDVRQMRRPSDGGTVVKSAQNGRQFCSTPYKKQNHKQNHKARTSGKPSIPPTPFIAVKGSSAETLWNELLAKMGHPPLSEIAQRGIDGVKTGWLVPFTIPPDRSDQLQFQKAEKWISASVSAQHLDRLSTGAGAATKNNNDDAAGIVG